MRITHLRIIPWLQDIAWNGFCNFNSRFTVDGSLHSGLLRNIDRVNREVERTSVGCPVHPARFLAMSIVEFETKQHFCLLHVHFLSCSISTNVSSI